MDNSEDLACLGSFGMCTKEGSVSERQSRSEATGVVPVAGLSAEDSDDPPSNAIRSA